MPQVVNSKPHSKYDRSRVEVSWRYSPWLQRKGLISSREHDPDSTTFSCHRISAEDELDFDPEPSLLTTLKTLILYRKCLEMKAIASIWKLGLTKNPCLQRKQTGRMVPTSNYCVGIITMILSKASLTIHITNLRRTLYLHEGCMKLTVVYCCIPTFNGLVQASPI